MKRVAQLHRCNSCGLQVNLRAPVTRPCPACGDGEFEIVALNTNKIESIYSQRINRIVEDTMPEIYTEIDNLLIAASDDGGIAVE